MGSWRGTSTRYTREGLTPGSGWSSLASSFFEIDAPGTAATRLRDAFSIASGTTVAGTGAATLDALTGSGTGASGARATGAATLATIVSAGTGTAAGGSSAVTLSALTSTASGVRGAAGTAAATLATIVSAGSGQVTIFGSVATQLDDLTGAATDAALPVTIDFEDGTIPAALLWSGDPGTVVDRADAGGGTLKALQFRDIGDSEQTTFELYAVAHLPGSATLTVRFEVSSEENYDFLRVLVDDVDVLGDPGVDPGDEEGRSGITGGFESFSVALSEGEHTLRFGYYKDSSADDGDDTAWISSITYPAGTRPVVASSLLDDLTSSASGETEIFPGYRFWRITTEATGSISGTSGGIGEVELRASLGGADLTDTLPGIASQPLGSPWGVDYPASNAFDNDQSTSWFAGTKYSSLQWEFTTYPQDIAQVNIKAGTVFSSDLLDLSIERSYGGEAGTWETIATKRGIVEAASFIGGETTINLIDPAVPRDGYLGINDFGATITSYSFCEPDFVSVVGHYTPTPIAIERLISYSSSVYPLVIGATTYPFYIRGVIYAADGPGGDPGTLLATSAERTSVPNDWFELFLSGPLPLPPGTYYLGVQVGGTSGGLYCKQTVGSNTRLTVGATYASGAPATFPGGSSALAQNGAIYAIYPISTGTSTLASATSTATGLVNSQPIEGTAGQLLDDMAAEAAGTYFFPVTGTAATSLDALVGAAIGARGVLRPQVSLHGTYRPTKTLHATWVPR